MKQTSFQTIKDYLKCVTCSKFNGVPKVLSCKHFFCKTCIELLHDEDKYVYKETI